MIPPTHNPRVAIAVFSASALSHLLIGWSLGYQSIGSYCVFWLLLAIAGLAAWNIARGWPAPDSSADAAIRAAVISVAIVVACALALGAAGRLTTTAFLVSETSVLAASLLLPRRSVPPAPGARAVAGLPAPAVGVVGALLIFAVGFAATHSPLTLYDSMSYHLFFSARWVQDHALSIIPTPFSDEAQAYAPANGELVFAWMMLPFHGDLVARMGQFPFGLLAAVTLYALARRLGAAPWHAVYPAAFLLLSRPVVEQIIGANVDLVCAAMLLTSLYLGVVAIERGEGRDWALWGVSLGLYWGTKYVALVYTPVLLLLAVARGPRARALWALPGVAAFALPWYLRNWVVAGSPIYPASLSIGGVTLARGAFGRGAMLNTVFHTTDVRLFPAMAAHAFGPALLIFCLPFAVAGWIAMARRGWWPHGFFVAVPFLMVPLYWFGFPVNIDSRFLMAAIGPTLLPLAFTFRGRRAWDACLHVVYTLGMVWVVAGVHKELPATLPWFMGGWLALDGLIKPPFLLWFAMLAAALTIVWRFGRKPSTWVRPAGLVTVMALPFALAAGGGRWCAPARCEYLDTTPTSIRSTFFPAWRWIAEHVAQSTIAYTGNNLPYPLSGDRLTNRVVYVNIDGRLRWRFHDYDRAYRRGRFNPVPPLLATSSGELMPVSRRPGPRDDAVRPRYERMQGIRDAWMFNLERLHVGYLFVSALSAYEIDYNWHDEGGFPIEEEWAKSDPHVFRLVYENPQIHIYAIDISRKAQA